MKLSRSSGVPLSASPPTRLSSMRARMTLSFAVGIAVVTSGGCVTVYESAKHTARSEMQLTVQQVVAESAGELKDGNHNLRQPAEFLREEGDEAADRGIALFLLDGQGHALGRAKHAPLWPPPSPKWIIAQTPVDGRIVAAASPWYKREHELHEFRALLCGLTLLVVAAGALGSWVVVGRTLRPLTALSQQAQAASTEQLRVRLQSPSDDAEMIGLVATLNGLLGRLEESAAARGRFYAAASHELRTPLQVLSGHLELALSRPRSNQEYRTALEEAHGGSRRLMSLTQELLMLNQLETRRSPSPADHVDVCDVVERALGPLQGLVTEHNLHITSELPAQLSLYAPWNQVEMLVRNVLENAVKYATPGGKVKICAHSTPQGAHLEAFNECTPPQEWDEERLFEPFYRPDMAREGVTGGNGLGLAICKAICDTNGWSITLRPVPEGVCASVEFKMPA